MKPFVSMAYKKLSRILFKGEMKKRCEYTVLKMQRKNPKAIKK